jgi:two-component system response regulator AtoC
VKIGIAASGTLFQYLEGEIRAGSRVAVQCADLPEALRCGPQLVFAEWIDGPALGTLLNGLALARRATPPVPVVVLVPAGAAGLGRRAVSAGASDWLFSPPDPAEIRAEIVHAAGPLAFRDDTERRVFDKVTEEILVGASPVLRHCLEEIRLAARSNLIVLLVGETGTGKGMCARAIHQLSDRASRPFRTVVCAAKPAELMESELFGAAKGAYTGSIQDREGDFAAAGAGTILLDEIGDIPLALQVKLLRVIEERVFQRLGDSKEITFWARLVCATLVNLEEAVAAGTFRRDFLGRVDQFRITVPPLRERPSDIPVLARRFLKKYSGDRVVGIGPSAMKILEDFDFPENVRQLENAIQSALGRCFPGNEILPKHLPRTITSPLRRMRTIAVPYDMPYADAREAVQQEVDRAVLGPALKRLGTMERVAKEYSLNRDTVAARLAKAERNQGRDDNE